MKQWAMLLGGLIVWTVHFFTLYVIASVLLTTTAARILTLLVTLACLAADALLASRALKERPNVLGNWRNQITLLGAGLSFIAVLWQGLPALLS